MKNLSTTILLLSLFAFYVNAGIKPAPQDSKAQQADSRNVNFYFENSASMNGYLSGDNNFLITMHRIIGRLQNSPFNGYFVNTEEHKVNNLLQRIDSRNIKQGNTSQSDHRFIFTNAIRKAQNNNLSIVVTDGIYSVNGKSPAIVAEDIQIAFENALKENRIETVIIKLTSMFDGYYYSESCPPGQKTKFIKQNRPYYILLFGSSEVINNTLNNLRIENLPGFNDMARFFITDNLKTNYTIITKNTDVHGKIIPIPKYPKSGVEIHQIQAERYEAPGLFATTPAEKKYLQFGVAVNYDGLELPQSYLIDVNNYKNTSDLDFHITSVVAKNTEVNGNNYTHIITLQGIKSIYGNLTFVFENNMPGWITKTGTDNDCEINGNETQTYAFDELIKGISNAYKEINNSDEYTNFNIQIKPL
jgi:hypothetical protein